MNATSTNDRGIPRCVAIVAMGPSYKDYTDECSAASGRLAVADETWAINVMAGIIQNDRAFIMDDLSYFAKAAREHKHLAGYGDWLHRHPMIYTSRADKDFPGSVDYPLAEVLSTVKFPYFNTTCPYALAYAIHMGIPHVKLYGMDYTQKENRGMAEAGRACMEYWIAVACSRGIKVTLSQSTTLCDQAMGRQLYGYSFQPDVNVIPSPET